MAENSKTTENSGDESTPQPEKGRRIDVKEWPNINIPKWIEWGFNPAQVLRTPKYNFIFQRIRSGLRIIGNDHPAFVLEGRWFRIDVKNELIIEKLSWAALLLIILFFSALLRVVYLGGPFTGINAAMLFALMYIVDATFMTYALAGIAGPTEKRDVVIPFGSVTRAVHVERQGVIFVEWREKDNENGTPLGISFRLNPDTGREVMDRLNTGASSDAVIISNNESLVKSPPKSQDKS